MASGDPRARRVAPLRRPRRARGRFARLRVGVAEQILVAISVMFLGIVLLTTSVLYIQLSQANSERARELLTASAESLAESPGVHAALFSAAAFPSPGAGSGQMSGDDSVLAAASGFAPGPGAGWIEGTEGRDSLTVQITEFQNDYGLDGIGVYSAAVLRGPELSGRAPAPGETIRSTSTQLGGDTGFPAGIDRRAVLRGETVVQFVDDADGGALYAVAPVYPTAPGEEPSADDEVAAAVVTGLRADTIRADFAPQGRLLLITAAIDMLLGTSAVWLASRGLKRATGDYGSEELGDMLRFYSSVLQAVSEGLLLIDRKHGIVLHNAEAAVLLDLPDDAEGGPARTAGEPVSIVELNLPSSLHELLVSGRWAQDEIHYTDTHVLVVNQQPTKKSSDTWVTTMRDHTELQELSGELVSVRSFSESLRSQTHEYANRLHMVVSLIETGNSDQALDFATREISQLDRPADNLLGGFDHPILSALLLTKYSQAKEAGIELTVDTEELCGSLRADDRDLVTILGNLLDNAFDAVSRPGVPAEARRVQLRIAGSDAGGYEIEVADDGPGIAEEDVERIFERGFSTKHDGVEADSGSGRSESGSRGVGLSLVVQAVRRLGGAIEVRGGPECEGDPAGAAFEVWLPGGNGPDGASRAAAAD
ncbi:sensor histidine kinase [Brevibacterium daeguense]|uniref:sensor histidine kinase n=1 Tax=Brevibacterium daeguense TaxID=909936 RepID=UPI001F2AB04D|nr:ATP-binding protein [Brevibacterium daeguense]